MPSAPPGRAPGGQGAGARRPVRVDDLGDLLPAARSLWGYVWAAPNSLVGLAGALTTRRRPVRWRGVLLFEDASGGLARFLRWRGFAAITLGHVIVANRRMSDGLLAHELQHVAQHERWGPLYYPAYLLGSIRGYRRNPFERAARQAATVVQTALEERTRGRRS
jgi:hypothetical protein